MVKHKQLLKQLHELKSKRSPAAANAKSNCNEISKLPTFRDFLVWREAIC